jgi:outer membrane protein assembly factor BamB
MNCEQVNQKIEFFVLGELSESQQVAIKQHLAICPACRAAEADYCRLINDIKKAVQPDLPGFDFVRAVRSTVDSEIRAVTTRSRARRIIAITGSAAACLLLGLTIWLVRVLGAPTPFDSPSVSLVWQYRGARSIQGAMGDATVVRGQRMYLLHQVGSQAYVVALDAKTGQQKWQSDTESCGYLVADDSRVYCLAPASAGRFDLVALDRSNGKMLWRYPQLCPDQLQNPCQPTLLSGGRICWTTNTTVHMLDSADGKELWTCSIPDDNLLSRAIIMNDSLYVAGSGGLYCLNITSGKECWRLAWDEKMAGWDRPLLAVADGQIYAAIGMGFGGSRLLCMEPTEHKLLWSKVVPYVSHLYIAGGKLYLRHQNVQALDRTTGELLWTYSATGCSPVTYANGLVYFTDSSDKGHLIALNEHTGGKAWELVGVNSCNAFIKVDSTGYIKTREGVVYAAVFKG